MANVDFQLLRDWFNSNYYTGLNNISAEYLPFGETRKQKERYSEFLKNQITSRPLEIDPRVKYRVANLDAVKQFDKTGRFIGPVNYSPNQDLGLGSLYFSQGLPLHQYAFGNLLGTGTARAGEQTPYLIATVGDDWGSRYNATAVENKDIRKNSFIDAIEERISYDTQQKVIEAKKDLEQIQKELSKLKQGDSLDDFLERIAEAQASFSDIDEEVTTHIHGSDNAIHNIDYDSSMGQYKSSLLEFLGHDSGVSVKGKNKITTGKNFLPDYLGSLNIDLDTSSLNRLRNQVDYAIRGLGGVVDSFNPEISKLITGFSPTILGESGSGEAIYGLPSWLNASNPDDVTGTGSASFSTSDIDILQKIRNGTATPKEINKVYGLGALNDFAGGFYRQPMKLFGNYAQISGVGTTGNIIPTQGGILGAAETEVIPRSIISDLKNRPRWSVVSPSLEVGNYRPFAIWQYTKNGLRLINEGNNNPVVGGVKPIPTDKVDSDLVGKEFTDFFGLRNSNKSGFDFINRYELSNLSVNEAVKKFGEQGWKRRGFVDTSAFTKPFQNLSSYMTEVPMPKIPAGSVLPAGAEVDLLATIRQNYLNNPQYRSAVNASTLGKLGTAAAIVSAPFDSINRRDAYEKYLVDNGATEAGLMMARVPVGIASGLETAANFATLGLYDAFSPSVSAQANRQADEDQFYRDLAMRKYIQQGIDYPVIGGQVFERTTK